MAQSNQKRSKEDYINNLFIKRVWSKQDDPRQELFSIGVNVRGFIEELNKLSVNDKGFANLTMGTRKDDADKMSVWKDDYKKDSQSSTAAYAAASVSSRSATPPPSTPPPSASSDDDLPF